MACVYSPGIVDMIDRRWSTYDYDRSDVIDMIARISRPSRVARDLPVSANERVSVEALLAAGCE